MQFAKFRGRIVGDELEGFRYDHGIYRENNPGQYLNKHPGFKHHNPDVYVCINVVVLMVI